jgi:hypothetical protein
MVCVTVGKAGCTLEQFGSWVGVLTVSNLTSSNSKTVSASMLVFCVDLVSSTRRVMVTDSLRSPTIRHPSPLVTDWRGAVFEFYPPGSPALPNQCQCGIRPTHVRLPSTAGLAHHKEGGGGEGRRGAARQWTTASHQPTPPPTQHTLNSGRESYDASTEQNALSVLRFTCTHADSATQPSAVQRLTGCLSLPVCWHARGH